MGEVDTRLQPGRQESCFHETLANQSLGSKCLLRLQSLGAWGGEVTLVQFFCATLQRKELSGVASSPFTTPLVAG